jgi:hypothetical protein
MEGLRRGRMEGLRRDKSLEVYGSPIHTELRRLGLPGTDAAESPHRSSADLGLISIVRLLHGSSRSKIAS